MNRPVQRGGDWSEAFHGKRQNINRLSCSLLLGTALGDVKKQRARNPSVGQGDFSESASVRRAAECAPCQKLRPYTGSSPAKVAPYRYRSADILVCRGYLDISRKARLPSATGSLT